MSFIAGSSGSGGAGGGASSGWGNYSPYGGGTDIYGQGVNGQGGTGGDTGTATGGYQGSNVNGTQTVTAEYGGGAGGGVWSGIYNGNSGAVRIIWGAGRAFPSTHTGDL